MAMPETPTYPEKIDAAVLKIAGVVVLGATTGSHLGLPDGEELALGVIWLADVVDGRLTRWQIADDTSELRAVYFPGSSRGEAGPPG